MSRPAKRPAPSAALARPGLAARVQAALGELARDLQGAEALAAVDPRDIHRGLLAVVMRLLFVQFAEETCPLPGPDDTLAALRLRLLADATPSAERRAWPRLLAHLVRRVGDSLVDLSPLAAAPIGDDAVLRALQALLLDGAPVSAEVAGVEQLGGVYESLLERRLQRACGPAVLVGPREVLIDLAQLLSHAPGERPARVAALTGRRPGARASEALAAATTIEGLAAALARNARAVDIIPPGALCWTAGEDRRRAGAHYTPRERTAPVVRAALRPLLDELGADPTPAQLLALKVCDPAMGSGAFLLEVCRQLGERLERAWQRHGGPPVASDIPRADLARLYVARRCVHGVDKDPCAVELARLSHWLLTRAAAPPAAFAGALRCGDALVGLDARQLAAARLDPAPDCHDSARRLLAYAASVRPIDDEPAAASSTDALDPVRLARALGDALVATFFADGRERRRDEQRERFLADLLEPARRGDRAALAALERLGAALHAGASPVRPFHWELEFPRVFARDEPGFDVFVGNPPYFWGNRISRAFGDRYRDWLLRSYPRAHGNSDLAAYFLRRAFILLRRGGTLGFVTTNSIAEADTRQTGLDELVRGGGHIYEAVRSAEWGGGASVRVAHVFVRKGQPAGPPRLDGRAVAAIGSDLRPLRAAWTAVRLRERAGQSFKGVDFGGTGFLLTAEQRAQIVRRAPHEAACIWPVLNASQFSSSPRVEPSGYIINFTGRDLADAERFTHCMDKLRREVLPRRAVDKRKARRERWWLYNEACSGLYRAIAGKPAVLACAVVAKYIAFAFVDVRTVFTNALNIFAFDSPAALAVLQSRVHELWALTHSSSLRADPRYNPSDCFETFPFPPGWRHSEALEQLGRRYHALRGECMQRNRQGLTATYNRFHDPNERAPDILALRAAHAELDRAVLAAYGWTDLAARATCEFTGADERSRDVEVPLIHPAPRLRWPQAFADEVFARLLALNQARAAEERGATRPSPPPMA